MALQDAAAEKIILNGETIIDVTETTATEEAVFSGRTFLGADGKAITGTLKLPLQIVDDSGYLSLNKDKNTIYARYQSGADVDSINSALFNRTPKINEIFYTLIRTNDNIYLPCYCQCTGVISGNNYWTFKIVYLVAPNLTVQLSNQNLDDYKEVGRFYFGGGENTCINKPEDVGTFGMFVIRTAYSYYSQVLMAGDFPAQQIYTRTFSENSSTWTSWQCQTSALILQRIVPFAVPYSSINISNYTNSIASTYFNRYPITGDTFVLTGISSDGKVFMCKAEVTDAKNPSGFTPFKIDQSSLVLLYDPSGFNNRIKDLEDNTAGYATRTEAQGYATTAENNAKAYTNEIKATVLGENDKLIATYDTLSEIGQWIESSGVDVTDLTTAIATETKAREEADANLESQIDEAIKLQTEWTNNQLEFLYNDVLDKSGADATTKANTAETNAETYTDQKLENYYNKTEIDAIFEPVSEGAVIRDENGDIIVPETPSSANAAISYAYAQEIGIANAIATRPYIREYTVADNAARDTQLSTLLNGYDDATGEGPYRGDHVKITVTATGLTHLYYYNQTNNRMDLPSWIEIAQYYADLSSKLSSINSSIKSINQVNTTQTTQIGKMSSSYTLSGFQAWFQVAQNCGGVEVMVASPRTEPYDFVFMPSVNTHVYYKGIIRIFYEPQSNLYFLLGNKCTSTGTIIEEDSRMRIYPVDIDNISGCESGFAVARAFYYK